MRVGINWAGGGLPMLTKPVEIDGVQVLLSSAKMQMLDADLFRFLGVEPARTECGGE